MLEAADLGVSRETAERLRRLCAEVARWNRAINLVAPSTVAEIWNRHVLDSLQLLRHAPDAIRRWADLGSGGGFPGLVIAAALAERSPQPEVVLVDSDRRKAVFLKQTATAMGLDVQVVASRAESLAPLGADVVSARALAPLVDLLGLVRRHLAPEGLALLLKGAGFQNEVAVARERFAMALTAHPSLTRTDAVVLAVGDIRDA